MFIYILYCINKDISFILKETLKKDIEKWMKPLCNKGYRKMIKN